MSLWACPTHGLYGGQAFCPKCGGPGAYVTLPVGNQHGAQADRNPKGHDPAEGHGRNDESPVGNADAPKGVGHAQ